MKVVIPYSPRPLQKTVHNALQRFNVLVCHRRWGKTVFAINEDIKGATGCRLPNPRTAYIAPLQKQAKRVSWDYAKFFSRPIPGITINEAELRIDYPNGGRMEVLGADNADSLRGTYLDLVVLDEFSQMNPSVWSEVIRPALADRKGRAIFIGTPKGHNNFYKLYQRAGSLEGWYRQLYRASETGILDEEELRAARREMSQPEYAQEFECSWSAAIKGAYWADAMEKAKITRVPYDENWPVITSWDLGIRDSTVIWFFQNVGTEVRVINCLAFQGMGLPDIVRKLKDLPYLYTQHIAPHDARVRELGSGKSRIETAEQLGVAFDIAPQLHVQDGIQQVRSLLSRCIFDGEKCETGIEALRQYRSEYDERRGVLRTTPLHDWCSDYADAFRYFAITPLNDSFGFSGDIDYSRLNRAVI